jgi:hypothetical protein
MLKIWQTGKQKSINISGKTLKNTVTQSQARTVIANEVKQSRNLWIASLRSQ